MNFLSVGSDPSELLHHVERLGEPVLVLDDGPFIDALDLPKARTFDVAVDGFNPLRRMSYRKAHDLLAVFDAAFSEWGPHTRAIALHYLQEAFLGDSPRLSDMALSRTKEALYARMMVERVLRSPLLTSVLDGDRRFSFKTRHGNPVTILARLDRAELGDFDAFILGNLLIAQYQGTVVIPDFGFYACAFHSRLIRQGRLIAGIGSFDEVPDFRSRLLLFEDKVASRCTMDDAIHLAKYQCRAMPNTDVYKDFIDRCVSGP